MTAVNIPKQRCPHCGYKIDCSTALLCEHAEPRPGDITLCLHCMEVFLFNNELRMKRATKRELRGILNSRHGELIIRAQNIGRFVRRKYG